MTLSLTMPAASPFVQGPILAPLWDRIPQSVAPAQCRERKVFSDWAEAVTPDQIRLCAREWQVHQEGRTLADCRLVMIQGPDLELVSCTIFPTAPHTTPVLVLDSQIVAGVPRMAFADLHSAGMCADLKPVIRESAIALASRHGHLPRYQEVPPWVARASLGGHILTRPIPNSCKTDLPRLFSDALQTWAQIALYADGFHPKGESSTELLRYKKTHGLEAPVMPYLTRFFGESWAHQFRSRLLYR